MAEPYIITHVCMSRCLTALICGTSINPHLSKLSDFGTI